MCEPVVVRNKDVIVEDIRVLNHWHGELVLDLGRSQAFGSLRDDETLNVVVLFGIASPNNMVVGEGGVAGPSLFSVDDIPALGLGGDSFQRRGITAVVWLR